MLPVVRVSNETMSPALQLPVEFVEHEVAEQWRNDSPNAKDNFEFERRLGFRRKSGAD
jgi:hypothetical protein